MNSDIGWVGVAISYHIRIPTLGVLVGASSNDCSKFTLWIPMAPLVIVVVVSLYNRRLYNYQSGILIVEDLNLKQYDHVDINFDRTLGKMLRKYNFSQL